MTSFQQIFGMTVRVYIRQERANGNESENLWPELRSLAIELGVDLGGDLIIAARDEYQAVAEEYAGELAQLAELNAD